MNSFNLFITGLYRSGTTLLEKVLQSLPHIQLFSQPFPFLFYQKKEKFNNEHHLKSEYPISHQFARHYYYWHDFMTFLHNDEIPARIINDLIENQKNYSGCWTKETDTYKTKTSDDFIGHYQNLLNHVQTFYPFQKDIKYFGSKEILGEEFIPCFLENGIKSILIIRDPRDVASSAHTPQSFKYTGKERPLLYTLRLWRKSVAYSIRFKDDPNFLAIRYEDLVEKTLTVLNEILSFLDLNPISGNTVQNPLLGQDGSPWRGNSSFQQSSFINNKSLGRYEKTLTEKQITYIESICRPELLYLKYKLNYPAPNTTSCLNRPLIKSKHPRFSFDYSLLKTNQIQEEKRLHFINSNSVSPSETPYFIFPECHPHLNKFQLSTKPQQY